LLGGDDGLMNKSVGVEFGLSCKWDTPAVPGYRRSAPNVCPQSGNWHVTGAGRVHKTVKPSTNIKKISNQTSRPPCWGATGRCGWSPMWRLQPGVLHIPVWVSARVKKTCAGASLKSSRVKRQPPKAGTPAIWFKPKLKGWRTKKLYERNEQNFLAIGKVRRIPTRLLIQVKNWSIMACLNCTCGDYAW